MAQLTNPPLASVGAVRRWLRLARWSFLLLWLAMALALWVSGRYASGPWFWNMRGDFFGFSTAFGCVQVLHAAEGNDGPVTLLRYDGPVKRTMGLQTANHNGGLAFPNPSFFWLVHRFHSHPWLVRNRSSKGGIAFTVTEYQLPHWMNIAVPAFLLCLSWSYGFYVARVRRKRICGGLCLHCGYDLRGSLDAGRCPECGHVIDEMQRQAMCIDNAEKR